MRAWSENWSLLFGRPDVLGLRDRSGKIPLQQSIIKLWQSSKIITLDSKSSKMADFLHCKLYERFWGCCNFPLNNYGLGRTYFLWSRAEYFALGTPKRQTRRQAKQRPSFLYADQQRRWCLTQISDDTLKQSFIRNKRWDWMYSDVFPGFFLCT